MGNITIRNAAPDLSISVTADMPGSGIPDRYIRAYEQMCLMKSNPRQFLYSNFRLIMPLMIHCRFADGFRNYVLADLLEKLYRHYEDRESLDTVKLGMKRLLSHPSADLAAIFFHDPVAMMTQKEWVDYGDFVKKVPELMEKYHHAFSVIAPTEFYYHHGLFYIDKPEILARISEGIAFDCGSFDGQSIAVMSEYRPKKIIGFEPSEKNIMRCRQNLQNAQIACEYDIVESCVGNRDGFVPFNDSGDAEANIGNAENGGGCRQVPICKLDTFCENNGISGVSWIKADLEGAGLEMVKGAEHIIRRDHPLLTLGIYHSPQEFFEIPEYLHQWVPEYKMMLRRCQCEPQLPYNELTLIAYVP